MEERLIAIMAELENQGGMVAAIESGYVQGLIAQEAYRHQIALEAGQRVVVASTGSPRTKPPPDTQGYELDEKTASGSSSDWPT